MGHQYSLQTTACSDNSALKGSTHSGNIKDTSKKESGTKILG